MAEAARQLGSNFNVIPAGERWLDGSLRPALEDWLGAGAILRWLPGSRSPEAESAVALFERHREGLVATLDQCGSGRELDERGHDKDKFIAGQLDVSSCVARVRRYRVRSCLVLIRLFQPTPICCDQPSLSATS